MKSDHHPPPNSYVRIYRFEVWAKAPESNPTLYDYLTKNCGGSSSWPGGISPPRLVLCHRTVFLYIDIKLYLLGDDSFLFFENDLIRSYVLACDSASLTFTEGPVPCGGDQPFEFQERILFRRTERVDLFSPRRSVFALRRNSSACCPPFP